MNATSYPFIIAAGDDQPASVHLRVVDELFPLGEGVTQRVVDVDEMLFVAKVTQTGARLQQLVDDRLM